jgi:hypothetical protein
MVPRDKRITQWIHKLAVRVRRGSGKTWGELAALAVYHACVDDRNMQAAKIIWDRLDPAPDSTVTINQLVLREDLNSRLNALKSMDVDRLLPVP